MMMYQRSAFMKIMDFPGDESDRRSRSYRTDFTDISRKTFSESDFAIIRLMIFQLRKPDGYPCRTSARIFPPRIQSETFRSRIRYCMSAYSKYQKRDTDRLRQSHHDLRKDRKGRNRMSDGFIQRTRFYFRR